MKRYEHTQVGYVIITAMTAALILIGINLANAGMNWTAIVVSIVIGVALILFSSLTVVIWEDELEIRFGPGLIRRKFKVRDIELCQVVRNSWYYGWGIRSTPHGCLYNVSGFDAVEIKLKTGKKYRIGTDAPRELEAAIRQVLPIASRQAAKF
ncbi:MAG: hypothetical protein PHN78_04610 [Dehalococcoidales bacterium]|nr:hypothetical protein [Dehalococcoidales bacterium]